MLLMERNPGFPLIITSPKKSPYTGRMYETMKPSELMRFKRNNDKRGYPPKTSGSKYCNGEYVQNSS